MTRATGALTNPALANFITATIELYLKVQGRIAMPAAEVTR
jgi:hypothetical protein